MDNIQPPSAEAEQTRRDLQADAAHDQARIEPRPRRPHKSVHAAEGVEYLEDDE